MDAAGNEEMNMAKTYKSHLAAKMAYAKAERAFETTRDAAINAHHAIIANGIPENYTARMAPYATAQEAARLMMVEVYEAAQAQGYWVRSRHLGYNPTRELIQANID